MVCIGMARESSPSGNLVWMDLEMSGLDVRKDVILEIATVVTDADLNVVAEGPSLAIHHDDGVLEGMDEWNTRHHGESGLVERVRASPASTTEAEAVTLAFVVRHCAPGQSPLCGNSIWQDRRFLARHMPTLEAHFHYRIVDVSTVKELARRWRPAVADGFKKKNAHRALDDIHESIAELRHYRRCFFKV